MNSGSVYENFSLMSCFFVLFYVLYVLLFGFRQKSFLHLFRKILYLLKSFLILKGHSIVFILVIMLLLKFTLPPILQMLLSTPILISDPNLFAQDPHIAIDKNKKSLCCLRRCEFWSSLLY